MFPATTEALGGTYGSGLELMTTEDAIAFVERHPELPSIENYTSLLQKCRKSRSLQCAKRAHFLLCERGLENHKALGNYLVPMFSDCRSIHQAQQIFNRFSHLNEHSWTSLIHGLVECGEPQGALNMYEVMEEMSVNPSRYAFAPLLQACARLKCIKRGRKIHASIAKEALEGDPFLVSSLVDMYANCGFLEEAQYVFDCLPNQDVVCWTALITGYAEQGLGEKAWRCLEQMQLSGVAPDVVLWNAVIMAYAERGETDKALKVYEKMQEQGMLPSRVTFLNVTHACSNKDSLNVGVKIHAQIHKLAMSELPLVTALVDMYAKCGMMVLAQELFDIVPVKCLVTWNALITGYVHQGESELVFCLFDRMRDEGVKPDAITFLNLLSICSHEGFLARGQMYFQSMQRDYCITPTIRHYNCLIDLLGRLGRLNEAVMMMEQIPNGPSYVTWNSLLGACQKLADVEFCKRAFEHAVRSKLMDDGQVFILMSNICADVHEWEKTKKMEASQQFSPASIRGE
ncbi:hypothetical protein GOP47_0001086 [Adiantum capillus-veneris]|uniref:Pentatricopeptide repeat-containing protein n=1 Tax=Adiantum capillus-veneris TaxID=13818 RepID=A0A9D4VEQ3_ADICA|nr:hypothetical protein GOP47_0001086 [Adiantum capillus-veneris]